MNAPSLAATSESMSPMSSSVGLRTFFMSMEQESP